MNSLGRLVAGIVCMILIVLFPLQYIAQLNMETIDYLVEEKTYELSDEIRSRGYIDQQMYEQYLSFLDSTDDRYEIHFENIIPITGQDLSKKQEVYSPIKTNALKYINPKSLSSIANRNQFLKLSDSTHVHTNDCYEGHRHVESCGGFTIAGRLYEESFSSSGKYKSISLYCASCKTRILTMELNEPRSGTQYCSISAYGEPTIMYYSYNRPQYDEASKKFNDLFSLCKSNLINVRSSVYSDGTTYSYGSYIPANSGVEIPYVGVLSECPTRCTDTANDYTFYHYYDASHYFYFRCFYCSTDIIRVIADYNYDNLRIEYYNANGLLVKSQGIDRAYVYELIKYQNETQISKNHLLLQADFIKEGLCHGCLEIGPSCGLEEDTVTICDKVVEITANPSEIEVEKYTKEENLPFRLEIKYINNTVKTITSGYQVIGYRNHILGLQNVGLQYKVGETTYLIRAVVKVKGLTTSCPICHNTYELNADDTDPGCSYCMDQVIGIEVSPQMVEVTQGDSLPITVIASYFNGNKLEVTGWSSTYQPYQLGYQSVLIEYGDYGQYINVWVNEKTQVCLVCGWVYPLSEAQCPECWNTVTHITLSQAEITVRQHESIDIIVTAYYLDGTSREVSDWTIDYDTSIVGTYDATVFYGGARASLKLNVLSDWVIACDICGLVYEPQFHPRGCPVCSTTLIGIEAYLTVDSYKVQIGTEPSIMVVAIYKDSHRELKEDGFTILDYDRNQLGTQIIRVEYQGFSTFLEVELVNNLQMVICENGHMYYLDEKEEDRGCPFCSEASRDEVVYYYEVTYWNDIVNTVYENGKYEFQPGSYITILVTKKDVSILARMQRMFLKLSLLGKKRYFISGGEISSR